MGNFRVGNSKFSRFMNGKGFYIALAICLVAVGSAAYVAASNSNGLWNGNNGASSAASASSTSGANETVWGEDSTEQTNNVLSSVAKASSAAESSGGAVKNSSMTNDKGEKLIFMLPVNGDILTKFSNNQPVYDKTMDDYRVHNGVDISSKAGTAVVADADGTIASVSKDLLLGQTVTIDHGSGLISVFANLSANVTVKKGQKVSAGDIIGSVGQTASGESLIAPHLHYAMTKDGNYIDPLTYIQNK